MFFSSVVTRSTSFRWRAIVAVLVASCALLVALPASAQPVKDAARRAQVHLAAADAAARAKDWDTAAREYDAANVELPTAAALAGSADAQFQRKRDAEAYAAYDELLKSYRQSAPAATRKLAETRLKELAQRTGYVSVRINEPGASVLLDDRALGTSPVPALVRTTTGEHAVRVTKEGFAPFEAKVTIPADGKVIVEVKLVPGSTTGKLVVTEKNKESVHVLVDGADMGPAPFERDLPPGTYEVEARGSAYASVKKTVTVASGKTVELELEATARLGRIEVRAVNPESRLAIDGALRPEGSFAADVSPGAHTIRVTREGFEPFEKRLEVGPGEILVETVSLGRAAKSPGEASSVVEGSETRGLYGGFQLNGWAVASGSGNSVESSCAALGASACDASTPLGAGVSGYVGYAIAPLGFELYLMGMGDVTEPVAHFDGQKGSDINPLLARPARAEEFTIGRFGGGAAVRARWTHVIAPIRIGAAAGVGFAYKRLLMERTSKADDGSENTFNNEQRSVGYASPALSFELSGGYQIGRRTALVLGVHAWLETAGGDVATEASGDQLLTKEGARPSPIATPAYKLADGTQLFLGPYLGMHFGL